MIPGEEVLQLLRTLAAHSVVPSMDRLPANDEALHALLAELIGGERSCYAAECRRVAAEAGITVEELAGRAEFLLACLLLPCSDTYYERLGVTPNATLGEIRRRWAALIQRYHPDHLGRSDGWVADQARQLIEAYQTLKDPERRRDYDAALLRERAAVTEGRGHGSAPHSTRIARPMRQRWMPLMLLMIGLAGFTWVYLGGAPQPLPEATLPPPPKLLETRQQALLSSPLARPASLRRGPSAAEKAPDLEPLPMEASEPWPEPTSLWGWQPAPESEGEPSPEMPSYAVAQQDASWAGVRQKIPRRLAAPDVSSSDTPRGVRRGPSPAAGTRSPTTEPARILRALRSAVVSAALPSEETRSTTLQAAASPAVTAAQTPRDQAGTGASPLADEPLVLIETFRAAYEREDLGALMRLFTATPRERDVVGRSAVQALYARNFAALDQIHYELNRLEAMAPAANDSQVVHGWFRIRAVRRDDPSRPVDAAGAVRWVLRREANALRIAEIYYELNRQ
jgi:ketosteroid isomerase-like protein